MDSAAARVNTLVRIAEFMSSPRRIGILALAAGDVARSFRFGCGPGNTDSSLCHWLVAMERIAGYTRAGNLKFIFHKDLNGGLP
jgi:hypothetical protein